MGIRVMHFLMDIAPVSNFSMSMALKPNSRNWETSLLHLRFYACAAISWVCTKGYMTCSVNAPMFLIDFLDNKESLREWVIGS